MRRRHRSAHRRIWLALAVLLPLALLGGLATRLNGPTESAPVRLAPP